MLSIKKVIGSAVLLLMLNKVKGQDVKKFRIGYPALAVGATLLAFGQAAHAQNIEVTIRTTDASGAPMANVEVGTDWWLSDGKLWAQTGKFHLNATTGASGRATLGIPNDRIRRDPDTKEQLPIELIAYDKERRHAAYALLAPGVKEVVISLRPVAIVRQKVTLDKKVDFFPVGAYNLQINNSNCVSNLGVTITPDNEIPLPAGSYKYTMAFGDEVPGMPRGQFRLEPGQHLTLDPQELKLSGAAKSYGKPALPISVSEARGLDKRFRLEDYRGKWVFLEFWHKGCAPCIGVNLPAMIKFYDKHADKRDKFEVFAFHATGVKTLKELDTYLPGMIKNAWGGRSLPFPILLDASGQTARTWGISGYPTEILIDPQGRVVRAEDPKKYLEEQFTKR